MLTLGLSSQGLVIDNLCRNMCSWQTYLKICEVGMVKRKGTLPLTLSSYTRKESLFFIVVPVKRDQLFHYFFSHFIYVDLVIGLVTSSKRKNIAPNVASVVAVC